MPELRSQNQEAGRCGSWALALVCWCVVTGLFCQTGSAVTSKIHRQVSGQDLSKGEVNDVVIGSRGTIQLGHAAQTLISHMDGAWSISSLVASGGTVYMGTSPNGAIYQYSLGQLKKIYPTEDEGLSHSEAESVDDANRVTNEHVFAMTTDLAGRLLVGISGAHCRLVRLTSHGPETRCEFNDAKYIFALAVDEAGTIFVGTGPEGKAYQLAATAKSPALVYDTPDKNILSLAIGREGCLYAGTDSRGLIYRIYPKDRTATVLYDCSQPEVAGLVFADSASAEGLDLYAIGTSAQVVPSEREFRVSSSLPGRPEPGRRGGDALVGAERIDDSRKLNVANTKKEPPLEGPPLRPLPSRRGERPDSGSRLYRITPDGYVTEVASERAVFFCLGHIGKFLLIGVGNDARLLLVDPVLEQQTTLYQDKQASQVTALAVSNGEIVLGTANPAKLIKIGPTYATEGIYTSDLIDADQPARWGKLQIEADVPAGCRVLVASRSGNVDDTNDPTFSPWTNPVEATGPVPLACPLGRFCQYRLILQQGPEGDQTPVIREVTVASTIPNLAPAVDAVDITRIEGPPSKQGSYKIIFKSRDANDDKLLYSLYFRKVGHTNWIKLKDQLEDETFEWDCRTVEDGRYEIRVVASDERSNTPSTKMTGSRISDPVVVDNSGPTIRSHRVATKGKTTTVALMVTDTFSAIGQLEYTVDSNTEWKGAVPDDGVYDTTVETFTIQIEDLKAGEHVLAVKVSDDLGNTTYRSFDLNDAGQP